MSILETGFGPCNSAIVISYMRLLLTQHGEKVAWGGAGIPSPPACDPSAAHHDAPATSSGSGAAHEHQKPPEAAHLPHNSPSSKPAEAPTPSGAGIDMPLMPSSSVALNPVLPATSGQGTAPKSASSLAAGVIAATEPPAAAAVASTPHAPTEHGALAASNLGSAAAFLQQSPVLTDLPVLLQQRGTQMPSLDGSRPAEPPTSSIADGRVSGQDSGAAEFGGATPHVPPQS